jgi:hypothetical protein
MTSPDLDPLPGDFDQELEDLDDVPTHVVNS